MTAVPYRIAVAKPDWGIRGGFEVVTERIVDHLRDRGQDVRLLAVPAPSGAGTLFGERVTESTRQAAPELVSYLGMVHEFCGLDTHRADIVISTQPPSFFTPAARHLSIFFHHFRLFYDLQDVAAEAGIISSEEIAAIEGVRLLDQRALQRVSWFLAGSPTVRRRLSRFNGIERNVSLFLAGARPVPDRPPVPSNTRSTALCVSRHEFAKRTELFVAALREVPSVQGISVGTGGRRGFVQALAGQPPTRPIEDARTLWCRSVPWLPARDGYVGGVLFAGHVSDEELSSHYFSASCVVAPAFEEDYGLTAIEAMSFGKPVVVCADGGGLVDLVEHEVTGLIVAPNPRSIANAVERLVADRDLADRLGRNGREVAATYTWERAFGQLDQALEQVMSQ